MQIVIIFILIKIYDVTMSPFSSQVGLFMHTCFLTEKTGILESGMKENRYIDLSKSSDI